MTEKKNASFTKLDLGPTGKTVATNIARLRKASGLSYNELSAKLGKLETPIPPVGLRRIEAEARRVTVDDLSALSLALKTTPLEILTPSPEASPPFATGADTQTTIEEVRAWVRGETLLDNESLLDYWGRRTAELTNDIEALQLRLANRPASDEESFIQKQARTWMQRQLTRAEEALRDARARYEIVQFLIIEKFEAENA